MHTFDFKYIYGKKTLGFSLCFSLRNGSIINKMDKIFQIRGTDCSYEIAIGANKQKRNGFRHSFH